MANLTRHNPFNEVVSLREAMDRLFEDSVISPRTALSRGTGSNLYETAEGFVLQVPMPGVKPDDVEITAQQDTVTIKWEMKLTPPENSTVHWSSFGTGQAQQTFTLPTPINADRAEASYTDGILSLSLPKAEHARARTVKVNAHQ